MLLKENIIELHCCGRAWGAPRRSNQEQKICDKNIRDLLSFFFVGWSFSPITRNGRAVRFSEVAPTGKQKSKWTKVTGCGVVIYERFLHTFSQIVSLHLSRYGSPSHQDRIKWKQKAMTLQVKLDEHGSIGGTRYHKGDLMTKVGLGGTW